MADHRKSAPPMKNSRLFALGIVASFAKLVLRSELYKHSRRPGFWPPHTAFTIPEVVRI